MPLTQKKPAKRVAATKASRTKPVAAKATKKKIVKASPAKKSIKRPLLKSAAVRKVSRKSSKRSAAAKTRKPLGLRFVRGFIGLGANMKFFAFLAVFAVVGTATLLVTHAASITTTVNDSMTGTGQNQFEFVGNWCRVATNGAYNNDEHCSNVAGAYYQVRFTGTQVKAYSMKNPNYGKAAYSVDGGPETVVDHYASNRQFNFLAYTSPVLTNGPHVLKVRVLGVRSSGSDSYVAADRVEVTSESTAPSGDALVQSTFNDGIIGTGANQYAYTGYWGSTTTTGAYNNDEHFSNSANAYYEFKFSGATRIDVYSMKNPNYGIAGYSIDGGPETSVDHYASGRQFNFLAYSTSVTTASHTLKVRITGNKNASSSGAYVAADRIVLFTPTSTGTTSPTTPPATGGTPVVLAQTEGEATGSNLFMSGSNYWVTNDGGASGGAAMGLYGNSSLTWSAFFNGGTATKVVVRARADMCNGGPVMNANWAANNVLPAQTVSSTTYTDYTFTLPNVQNNTGLYFGFGNDYYLSSSCDRNLFIDKITVYGTGTVSPSPTPTPSPTPSPTPTPTPTPPPATGSRSLYNWPFSRYSVWNYPIGSNAQYVNANIADPSDWLLYSDGDVIALDPNAPQRQIEAVPGDNFWNGSINQVNYRCNSPSGGILGSVLVPNGFVTAMEGNTPNASGALLLPDKKSIFDTQPFSACSNGKLTSKYWNETVSLAGNGINGSHGGSGMSALGGTIRNFELAANYPREGIKHALKIVLDQNANFSCTNTGQAGDTGCYRWPARAADSFTWNGNNCPGEYCGSNSSLKPGSLLALDPSFNINSLKSEIGKRIAWTLQNYGMYVVDAAGWKSSVLQLEMAPTGRGTDVFKQQWGMSFEGGMNERSSNPWLSDYYTMLKSLKVVNNNAPNRIGGGGTPRQPFAPGFADGTADGMPTNPNQ